MRILLVNKFYFPQGGADKHVLQLETLLKARGHEVAIFAMSHPQNLPSPWAKYFVSFVDFSQVQFNWQGMRTASRMFYSFEAARKIDALIRDFKPDVVHIHNIYHQISPSILPMIAKHKIPIVQTLHDYALVSANYNLYAHGGICEHGRYNRTWEYVRYRCIKNSRAASFLAMFDQWWQNRRRLYQKYIGTFISPSVFVKQLVLDWTGEPLRIEVKPNFINRSPQMTWPKNGSFVYVGRLSPEKGVATFIRAAAHVAAPCHIVGTGPAEAELKKLAASYPTANIIWHGFLTGQPLDDLIRQATAVVVPSEWYENCPLVVLEAFSHGTPVIASRIGGLPELVHDTETGILCAPGRADEFSAAMNQLSSNPNLHERLSQQVVTAASQYTPGGYIESLLQIYATTPR